MSYGRNPYYIYSSGDGLTLNEVTVPDSYINAFLYKVLLTGRREELKARLKEGKEVWLNPYDYEGEHILSTPEYLAKMKDLDRLWMLGQEDDILKTLMGEHV